MGWPTTRTWVVARRLRPDEAHLGEPGEWVLARDLFSRDEAEQRSRYFTEALGSRSLAVDLDTLERHLDAQEGSTT